MPGQDNGQISSLTLLIPSHFGATKLLDILVRHFSFSSAMKDQDIKPDRSETKED